MENKTESTKTLFAILLGSRASKDKELEKYSRRALESHGVKVTFIGANRKDGRRMEGANHAG